MKKLKKAVQNVFGHIDAKGHEVLDKTPVAKTVSRRHFTNADRIREIIRSEALARELSKAGVETFQEADDFEIPDDPPDPLTKYEEVFEGDVLRDAANTALDTVKKRKAQEARVNDKTYSGPQLQKLVDWFRKAPQEEVDKLLKSTDK